MRNIITDAAPAIKDDCAIISETSGEFIEAKASRRPVH
jgi:hypothetical protein